MVYGDKLISTKLKEGFIKGTSKSNNLQIQQASINLHLGNDFYVVKLGVDIDTKGKKVNFIGEL